METELKEIKETIKLKRNRYLTKKMQKARRENDSKSLYSTLKNFQSEDGHTSSREIKCIKDKNNHTRFTTKDIKTVFYDFWHDMFTNDDDQIDIEHFDLENAAEGKCKNSAISQ